jgi:hypothetical protein
LNKPVHCSIAYCGLYCNCAWFSSDTMRQPRGLDDEEQAMDIVTDVQAVRAVDCSDGID